MLRTLIYANAQKPRALELAEDVRAFLEPRTTLLGTETLTEGDLSAYGADLVVVLGGDGTVLRAVELLGDATPLLLTVNLGRLGFLAEVLPDHLEEMLTHVLDGAYRVSPRMLLHVRLLAGEEVRWEGHALNEAVIGPDCLAQMINLTLKVDGRILTDLRGDGLIVSTPTGSTAYALSAGGPILNPEMHGMLLVPVCPHHLAHRPLLLAAHEILTIQHKGLAVSLHCDGRRVGALEEGMRVEVTPSPREVRMILGERLGRYDILRAKLGWGGTLTS